MTGGRTQTILLGCFGIILFLILWEVIGRFRLVGLTWPPFTEVIAYLVDPSRRPLFQRAISATLHSVALGYVIGAGVGLALSSLGHLAPPLKPGADRLSAVVHAIPSIALAPIFIVLLSREAAPVALSALNAFFVFYVAGSSGFGAASRTHLDLMHVLGARGAQRFRHVDLPAAVPSIVSGMKLAVPASLIGAILGEWFGAPRGLGILIVNAMQNFQIPLLWSAVVLVAITSLTLFTAMTILERTVYERFR
jgi:ABC-type nitrate/sulfonate/bicarbonate transport system permease component